jgi:hypothetical protein
MFTCIEVEKRLETILEMGQRGDGENDGGGEFN